MEYLLTNTFTMPMFMIEREIPDGKNLTKEQLKELSTTTCSVHEPLRNSLRWVHSFVTNTKVVCIYIAPSESVLQQHALESNIAIDTISEIIMMHDPEY
jgi:hypothetical protein